MAKNGHQNKLFQSRRVSQILNNMLLSPSAKVGHKLIIHGRLSIPGSYKDEQMKEINPIKVPENWPDIECTHTRINRIFPFLRPVLRAIGTTVCK